MPWGRDRVIRILDYPTFDRQGEAPKDLQSLGAGAMKIWTIANLAIT